jgi:hypothetical protein
VPIVATRIFCGCAEVVDRDHIPECYWGTPEARGFVPAQADEKGDNFMPGVLVGMIVTLLAWSGIPWVIGWIVGAR